MTAITRHRRCPGCGYDLFGLDADGACPECGRAIGKPRRNTGPKNPRRVAGQVRRQIKLQRDRFIGFIIGSAVMLIVAVGSFFVGFVPTFVRVTCFFLLPFFLFGIFADHRLYRRQQDRLKELEQEMAAATTNDDIKTTKE